MCVRKTLEASSLVVLSTRQCRLSLNKYGISESTRELDSWVGTHTHRVIVYIYVIILYDRLIN